MCVHATDAAFAAAVAATVTPTAAVPACCSVVNRISSEASVRTCAAGMLDVMVH
jgi:hypothetical protein